MNIMEKSRLFQIQNAIVKPIKIQGGKWVGGVVFPDNMPGIFRHRRYDPLNQTRYKDVLIKVNQYNHVGDRINNLKFYPGSYIYGGPFHLHFGHALTESIHRLWGFNSNIHDGIVFAVSVRPNTKGIKYTPQSK
ncbi:MAG: hypothetical protein QNJ68_15720 [Microcoleaceae cyanobacterium MO_207.B10]|nr:hypothetical protein [Microcoleaceae cyanobacterium MO_207.B10]